MGALSNFAKTQMTEIVRWATGEPPAVEAGLLVDVSAPYDFASEGLDQCP